MSIPFLSDIILKKGNKIEFTTEAGASAGSIDIDTSGNLVLSNTRIANLFNFPAITMPIKKNYWLSFSVLCKENKDKILLSVAQEIENVIYD